MMESKSEKVKELIKTDKFKLPWKHVMDVYGFDEDTARKYYKDNLDPKYRTVGKR